MSFVSFLDTFYTVFVRYNASISVHKQRILPHASVFLVYQDQANIIIIIIILYVYN